MDFPNHVSRRESPIRRVFHGEGPCPGLPFRKGEENEIGVYPCYAAGAGRVYSPALADDPGEAFSNLAKLDLGGIRIFYQANSSRLIQETVNDDLVKIMETKLDVRRPDEYLVMFDPGPSEDPAFSLFKVQGDQLVQLQDETGHEFWVGGLDLIMPGYGSFYVAGHINNMFNMRRKFVVDGLVVREVHQPFYYVGLDSETTQEVKLYSSMALDEAVAYLPQGAKVSVLINHGEYYLLKTPFGLVGWIKIPEYAMETPIKDIVFAGD